ADLVLGAAPEHRSAAVRLAPTALTTAFGLREFAGLAATVDRTTLPVDPVARAHEVVRHALRSRGMFPPLSPHDDHVLDPFGGP
ncbi:hypothetical protein, partial [Klebsiella pneumoniae]|uniref:hypothetical protein n=1 Tax=Klebsiella pneumoniae TaxID=573 RepID=UPI001F5B754A